MRTSDGNPSYKQTRRCVWVRHRLTHAARCRVRRVETCTRPSMQQLQARNPHQSHAYATFFLVAHEPLLFDPWQINLTHARNSTNHVLACRSWALSLRCLSLTAAFAVPSAGEIRRPSRSDSKPIFLTWSIFGDFVIGTSESHLHCQRCTQFTTVSTRTPLCLYRPLVNRTRLLGHVAQQEDAVVVGKLQLPATAGTRKTLLFFANSPLHHHVNSLTTLNAQGQDFHFCDVYGRLCGNCDIHSARLSHSSC